jgi:hypothetical protein
VFEVCKDGMELNAEDARYTYIYRPHNAEKASIANKYSE